MGEVRARARGAGVEARRHRLLLILRVAYSSRQCQFVLEGVGHLSVGGKRARFLLQRAEAVECCCLVEAGA